MIQMVCFSDGLLTSTSQQYTKKYKKQNAWVCAHHHKGMLPLAYNIT